MQKNGGGKGEHLLGGTKTNYIDAGLLQSCETAHKSPVNGHDKDWQGASKTEKRDKKLGGPVGSGNSMNRKNTATAMTTHGFLNVAGGPATKLAQSFKFYRGS